MSADTRQPAAGATVPDRLNVPRVRSLQFKRNFIQIVAAELRFPSLVELERPAIDRFRRAVKEILPLYEAPQSVKVSLPSGVPDPPETNHRFATKHRETSFTLTHEQLVLETRKYIRFENFIGLLEQVVEHALPLIDSSFFTRIGLRYVNTLPMNKSDLTSLIGWVNPDLIGPLTGGVYGSVSRFVQEIRGNTQDGSYTFRHGLGKAGDKFAEGYILDFDHYAETVEVAEVFARLRSFHDTNFSFFMWAIGPKARDFLGPGTEK